MNIVECVSLDDQCFQIKNNVSKELSWMERIMKKNPYKKKDNKYFLKVLRETVLMKVIPCLLSYLMFDLRNQA